MSKTLPPHEQSMSPTMRRVIGAVNAVEGPLAMVALVAAYGLAEHLVSSQEAAAEGTLAVERIGVLGTDLPVTLSMSLLLVGAAAGAVGSVIHQSIIFAHRAGHDTLERGFVWWYLLRPLWSGLLGAVVVTAVNAGLISIGDETTSGAGVTVLVTAGCVAGLFTDRVLDRLRDLLGATDPTRHATSIAKSSRGSAAASEGAHADQTLGQT
jgi:uncharacterized membrane protein YdcZ (DUF606 family)